MPQTEIEIDDFTTREIIYELQSRIDRKLLTQADIDALEKASKSALINNFSTKKMSVADEMKIEYFFANIDKITLEYLERTAQ
jgi:uncharacterized protein YdeI (YjbR/CyaY-like superfamily)